MISITEADAGNILSLMFWHLPSSGVLPLGYRHLARRIYDAYPELAKGCNRRVYEGWLLDCPSLKETGKEA